MSRSKPPRARPSPGPAPALPTITDASLEEVIAPICRAHDVELVQARWARQPGGAVLQVMIDRPAGSRPDAPDGSGVTLEDCTGVSRDLSTALDVHETIGPGRYRLEVSSPGLERPLVKLGDFDRFAGREANIKTRVPVDERRSFTGHLLGTDGQTVRMEIGSATFQIPFDAIAKAHLVYRFK
jgi:ribosome maturation factor RimP